MASSDAAELPGKHRKQRLDEHVCATVFPIRVSVPSDAVMLKEDWPHGWPRGAGGKGALGLGGARSKLINGPWVTATKLARQWRGSEAEAFLCYDRGALFR